ncbi:hypothetical protein CK507_13390 [Pseudomonas sp. WN033]|nr:hypothetical protein CK507_13390 [Pseudomonas sp. WN033]
MPRNRVGWFGSDGLHCSGRTTMQLTPLAIALSLGAVLALTGCSEPASEAPASSERVTEQEAEQALSRISGSLTYRARIALLPDSQVLVELRDAEAADGDGVLAEQRISLDGQQVPVNFALEVDAQTLAQASSYVLRATIQEGGRTTWASGPVEVDLTGGDAELGEIVLLPHKGSAFSNVFNCGQLQINVGYEDDKLMLNAKGQELVLLPAVSASGAKFELEGDPSTSFWSKGNQGWLTLNGDEYPLCVPPGAVVEPFKATGNEPFWSVELDAGELSLQRMDDKLTRTLPYRSEQESTSRSRIDAGEGEQTITLLVTERLCRDSMSGMPFPQQVSLMVDGETLQGCGGQPERLLQGVEWVVEDINGGGIIDRSRVTLNFFPDGRIAGRASCNNFMGQYALTGESLTVSQAATTMMACAPSLMEQEQRFLETLEAIDGFDFDDTGALLVRSQAGSLKAYPETR